MSAITLPRVSARPALRVGWVRLALAGLLAAAAFMYLWKLTASGYSNPYYAAAAKSASVSWKAWFFGSLDPGSFITVDKPPLSVWLMGLSTRAFGYSSFSLLLPQALCTLATVGLLFATVRRAFGDAAGLLAAAMLVLSPVTLALARVDMPDPLLVLLLVASGWATLRAVESGRTKFLLWAAAFVGLAFMTKMLQGWMVLPALAVTYLLAGPPRLAVRLRQLALAGVVMVVVSAAWPLAVSLWPGSTPYIGGSTDGTVWDLILGYNGLGRLFGEGAGGMGGGGGFGGVAGMWRLFNAQVGGQIAWLLPLAAVSLGAGLWLTRGRERTDLARAAWVLFGVWAVVHAVVFSFQQGTFHPYYVSALMPAVAALCAAGLVAMLGWARHSTAGMVALAAGVVGSSLEAVALLGDYAPAVSIAIVVAAAVTILALTVSWRRVAAVAAVVAVLAGPATWTLATVGRSLNGDNVTGGPATTATFGGGGRGGTSGSADSELADYLVAHQGSAKYLVAATGSQATASIIIATGKPVVTIGGFTGSDPAPTVSELAAMVKRGELKYVLLSDGGGRGGNSEISTWVQEHGTEVSGVSSSSGTLYKVSA